MAIFLSQISNNVKRHFIILYTQLLTSIYSFHLVFQEKFGKEIERLRISEAIDLKYSWSLAKNPLFSFTPKRFLKNNVNSSQLSNPQRQKNFSFYHFPRLNGKSQKFSSLLGLPNWLKYQSSYNFGIPSYQLTWNNPRNQTEGQIGKSWESPKPVK